MLAAAQWTNWYKFIEQKHFIYGSYVAAAMTAVSISVRANWGISKKGFTERKEGQLRKSSIWRDNKKFTLHRQKLNFRKNS